MVEYNRYYFYTNTAEQSVVTHGVPFRDFLSALSQPPKNLLLLTHEYTDAKYHPQSGFNFIAGDDIPKLAEDVRAFGDFCWADFKDTAALDRLTPQNIAELLYFAHKSRPLVSPFLDALGNRFAYTSHDGTWHAKIYTEEPDAFLPVLSAAIISAADTGQAGLRPLQPDKLAALWGLTSEGLLFDGGDVTSDDKAAELPFYIVGRFDNMDELINDIDEHKKTAKKTGVIRFSLKPAPPKKAPPWGNWRGKAATEGVRSGKHLKRLQDIAKDIVNGLP